MRYVSTRGAAAPKRFTEILLEGLAPDGGLYVPESFPSADLAAWRKLSYPALAHELRLLTIEIRAGKPRIDAFKNFASRTKVDDVQSLVTLLLQADRFGTSLAQALRTHADASRTRRRQNAEERAGKLGVKLVFPLVLFLFPAIYIVILGPAVITFIRVFTQL